MLLVQEGHLEQVSAEFEIDLEFILIELPKSLKERVEKTEMNGFTQLKLTLDKAYELSLKNGWTFPREYMQTYCNISQNGYINPSELKKAMKRLFKYECDEKFGEIVLAVCFGKSKGDIKIECLHPGVLTKSSVMTKVITKSKGETDFNFSFDAVALIKLECWPEAALEWLTRQRNWPSKRDVDKLSFHYYIIPKPSTQRQVESESK